MPRYISLRGVCYPAKEKVGLTNITKEVKKITRPDGTIQEVQPGEPFIYEGPDRAALYELWQIKADTLGMDFKRDPDLLMRVKGLGYANLDDYLKEIGWDDAKAEEIFKKNATEIKSHEIEKRADEIKALGGGKDFAGNGQDMYGGFGEPKNA